jgi:hypothetical protein
MVDALGWGLEVSRYVHLNPVRVGRFELAKAERAASRLSAGKAPSPELIAQRLERLQRYQWSSYRAYVGLEPVPDWLRCQRVLALAGKGGAGAPQAYRQYVEEPIRQGVAPGIWRELKGQVILGGEEFVRQVGARLRGNVREQRSLRALRQRPALAQVIAVVERLKGESWEAFRDRYGDWGRDLVLYLGRKECAMKLHELGQAAGGIDYGSVAAAVHRFERRLGSDKVLAQRVRQARARLKM